MGQDILGESESPEDRKSDGIKLYLSDFPTFGLPDFPIKKAAFDLLKNSPLIGVTRN